MAVDQDTLIEAAPPDATIPEVEAEELGEERLPVSGRLAVAVAFPTVAAAVLVGGVFTGASPRAYAIVAGLLGVGLAVGLSRLGRRPLLTNALIVAGLFAIGLLLLLTEGVDSLGRLRSLVADAVDQADLSQPPVDFIAGWKPIVGWLLGIIGFVATWLALEVRRPSLALLLPLPVAAIAGISVPESQQVASGLVALALFAAGLGLLSSEQAAGEDDVRPSASYEIRKALKALPVLGAVTVVLALLSQTDFLFPDPLIDPAQEPQRPKTVPLSEVEDRVLFAVESSLTGPWRIGSLDVYDGKDWRLPPFAQNQLEDVPSSGVVDDDLPQNVSATFTIAGLGGAVLPGLPNTVGVIAEGPKLAYDARNGNIRLASGTVTPSLRYTVAAPALPTVDELRAITLPRPKSVEQFTEIPSMPPPVADLVGRAKAEAKPTTWDQFDFLRTWILDNVTATGAGTPVSVTPDRVADMIAGNKKGSPFEIVAAQAMLARWVGIPSRIAYGFDGGDTVGPRLEVRPGHGATFVEVYFPGKKWLAVIGTPKKAEPTVGSDPSTQRFDPAVLPSDDIAVTVFLPTLVPPPSNFSQQLAVAALVVAGVVLLAFVVWTLYPALRKAQLRSRRREAALSAGTRARVALAYAEWRDHAADFGFGHPTDTPLMFLDRFIEDDEHTELAWLTTRVLWGDLRGDNDPMLSSVAEELSRALRRRLSASQPATMRAVALVSRISWRDPYAPETDLTKEARRERKDKHKDKEVGDREPVPEPA